MAAEESQTGQTPTPDLASVLRTLASLAPQNNQYIGHQPPPQGSIPGLGQPQEQLYNSGQPSQQPWQARSEHRSTTSPFPPPSQIPPVHQQYPQHYGHHPQQAPKYQAPPRQVKNEIDPSTIIEWSAGLRYFMKTVAKNENIVQEIKRVSQISQAPLTNVYSFLDDQSST